jgi:hypothetical protein
MELVVDVTSDDNAGATDLAIVLTIHLCTWKFQVTWLTETAR